MTFLQHYNCIIQFQGKNLFYFPINPVWKIKHEFFDNMTIDNLHYFNSTDLRSRGQIGYLNSNLLLRCDGHLKFFVLITLHTNRHKNGQIIGKIFTAVPSHNFQFSEMRTISMLIHQTTNILSLVCHLSCSHIVSPHFPGIRSVFHLPSRSQSLRPSTFSVRPFLASHHLKTPAKRLAALDAVQSAQRGKYI